ncbi:MAG: SRPBCC family protein [bacterium]|nr:SRPBCC family protein [bacterium]MCP5068213.1 SRPBCC family protein [bacterium]
MGRASVKKTLDIPVEALWKVVREFGDTSWMPAGTPSEVIGEGPGMTRLIGPPGQQIREQLESVDEASCTLVYTIPENIPFPVKTYRATVQVREAGDGSELVWACEFEPEDGAEESARAAIEGIYAVMIGWVGDKAAS